MSTTARLLADHPFCCFCGGTTAATTTEHQPARIIFPNKHRPKGMEYPSCKVCNGQSSGGEALLAMVVRVTGGFRANAQKDFDRFPNILRAIKTHFPGLLERMKHPARLMQNGIIRPTMAFDVSLPEVTEEFTRIAAKICLARYYERFKRAASSDCRISAQWAHVQNHAISPNVAAILQSMGAGSLLQQGTWRTDKTYFVKDYFENGRFFTIAIFHESVALIAMLSEPGAPIPAPPWTRMFMPVPGQGIIKAV